MRIRKSKCVAYRINSLDLMGTGNDRYSCYSIFIYKIYMRRIENDPTLIIYSSV